MEKEEPHLPCKETEEHRTAVQALFPLGRDGTSVPTETGINEYHVSPRDVPTIFKSFNNRGSKLGVAAGLRLTILHYLTNYVNTIHRPRF